MFDWSTHKKSVHGSDNFPLTWADDGHQYAAWGDGWGFNDAPVKVSLGVSRIIGGKDDYYGRDVWYNRGKSYGIISIAGVLYMWVTRDHDHPDFPETLLYKSVNKGRSWTRPSWKFDKALGIVTPKILQFGKDYSGAYDEYVYCYFVKFRSGAFSIQKPGEVHVFRTPKDRMMDRTSYRFFDGKSWNVNLSDSRPILTDPDGFGLYNSVSYNAPLKKFFMVIEHTKSWSGNMAIYSADTPFGPWSIELKQFGFGETTFYWNFSNKWLSSNGEKFVMAFTGVGDNDAFHTIEGSIKKKPVDISGALYLLLGTE